MKPVNRMYLDPDAEIEILIHKPISNYEISKMSDKELLETTLDIINDEYRP